MPRVVQRFVTLGLIAFATTWPAGLRAQSASDKTGARFAPGEQGSRNVNLIAHIPLGGMFSVSDIEIEQELSRPYAYVSRLHVGNNGGFSIIDLKVPNRARVLYNWRVSEPELHKGGGGSAPTYLKSHGRYYFVQAFQWSQQGPDADVGAIVFDVTGLPDTSKIKEVARIKIANSPGGFHEDFSYKHSDGRALFLATTLRHPYAHVYDIDKVVAGGDPQQGLVGRIPAPDTAQYMPGVPVYGYHDFYVGFDPPSKQDRFYGAGAGGCYVYDITNLNEPKLLTSTTGVAGMPFCHTFTPTPDGRFAVAETEYQYAPLRIFDLKPGLDGQVKTISRPIGAWTANWKGLPHNHEVRWPYVFVSHYEEGLQVFNMMDPTDPYTVGYFNTYDGPSGKGIGAGQTPLGNVFQGAFGVDVRNTDGLVVVSDMTTGFWAFKMDGFDGWNGHQWGMPNNSSGQDWDNGPDGAPKPAKVS